MIPIGHASTAGNLTFKSTATIVAKEGISMGAGAGAQKITTDVTGIEQSYKNDEYYKKFTK